MSALQLGIIRMIKIIVIISIIEIISKILPEHQALAQGPLCVTDELLAHHWGAAFLYMMRSWFPIGTCHKRRASRIWVVVI